MSKPPYFDNNSPPGNEVVVQQEQSHLPSTMVRETMPYIEEPEVHLRDYLDVILRRKWIVIITLLVVFSFIAISTLSETPMFLAKGTIKSSPKGMNVIKFEGVDDSYMKSQEFIATQIRLLQSERLLTRIITVMDPEKNGFFAQSKENTPKTGILTGVKDTISALKTMIKDMIRPKIDTDQVITTNPEVARQIDLERNLRKIRNGLRVTPIKNTQLLEISFENANPKIAAEIVNTLMEQFMTINLEGKLDSFRSAEVFLDGQIEAAKIKLEKSEQELNKYAKHSGIISLDSKLNLIMRQLEEVNNALSAAVTVRIAKESQYMQAQKSGGKNLPAVMDNEVIQELKLKHNELLSEYQVLKTVFKDEYPKIKELKAEMADLEARYTSELNRVVDSIRLDYEAAL